MCSAFKDSPAFICAEPLSVNLEGEREWGDLYEFIEIVRLPELLDFYRSEGMSLKRYLLCKNYALRNFSNYLIGFTYKDFRTYVNKFVFIKNSGAKWANISGKITKSLFLSKTRSFLILTFMLNHEKK